MKQETIEDDKLMHMPVLIKEYLKLKDRADTIKNRQEAIKAELKLYLKEAEIEIYEDSQGNLVSYKQQSRENLDKKRIKELLGEIQFKEVVTVNKFDVLKIISKESRDKIKKFIKEKEDS